MVLKYKNIFYLVISFSCINNLSISSNNETNINPDFVNSILNKDINEFLQILKKDKNNIKNNKQYYLDLALKNYTNIDKVNISNLLKLNNINAFLKSNNFTAFAKLAIGTIAIINFDQFIDKIINNSSYIRIGETELKFDKDYLKENLDKYKNHLLVNSMAGIYFTFYGIKELLSNFNPEKYIIKTLKSL